MAARRRLLRAQFFEHLAKFVEQLGATGEASANRVVDVFGRRHGVHEKVPAASQVEALHRQ